MSANTGLMPAFNNPSGVVVDSTGNIFVVDTSHNGIWKMTPTGGLTTLAGLTGFSGNTDGTGSAVRLSAPTGIALDAQGNVYVADTGNNTIRKGFRDTTPMTIVISAPSYNSNESRFGFTLTGPAGQWGVVEGSTDMIHWTEIWSRVLGGDMMFEDPRADLGSQQFYRARMP